jgi:hypothetical protein
MDWRSKFFLRRPPIFSCHRAAERSRRALGAGGAGGICGGCTGTKGRGNVLRANALHI